MAILKCETRSQGDVLNKVYNYSWPTLVVAMLLNILLILSLSPVLTIAQIVESKDRHGFDQLPIIHIDLDGDDKADTIQPRTYFEKSDTPEMAHWITFDLTLTTGQTWNAFYRYRFGTGLEGYWVWALKSAGDMNNDGRIDLVFYIGDDTTDETVLLIQESQGFKPCSTGIILSSDQIEIDSSYTIKTHGYFDPYTNSMIPERVIATWNPRKLCFDGKGLFWVNVKQTYLRVEPRESADAKEPLYRNNGVIPKFENNKMVTNGDWIKVDAFQPGWVKRQELVTSTCLIQPDK